MALQPATIKVWCRMDTLDTTANLIAWTIGHPVEIADADPGTRTGCVLISTGIEYYESDETILDQLGLNIIGKIKGVVSWEVLPRAMENIVTTEIPQGEISENVLIDMLRILPVPISIMRRMNGQYYWKCLEASGRESTSVAAIEAALTYLTRSFKLIRSELIG